MNAKKSLCTLLEALTELGGKVERTLLIDFILGNESKAIKKKKLEEHELFACGDERDEDHYNAVIDEAIKQKFMTEKNNVITASSKGKKALKDTEAPFQVGEEEGSEEQPVIENGINNEESPTIEIEQLTTHETVGSRSRLKIQLLQAIDRKLALDDFAELQHLDFNELLDMIEALKQGGHKFDLNYFLQDVLDEDGIHELNECFLECKGDLQAVYDEMGDVYSMEEIRLAYLQWKK